MEELDTNWIKEFEKDEEIYKDFFTLCRQQ